MKTFAAETTAHLAERVTTLAACWRVERTDGVLILGTEHDRDLIIAGTSPTHPLAGTYLAQAGITGSDVRSTADISVDNLEVTGGFTAAGELNVIDLSAADIEAGLFDDATVTLFVVNWADPDADQVILRTGNIGEIRRNAEGEYKTELRGLAQRLTQVMVRTYGPSCDAELGDARCRVDLEPLTLNGTVTAVVSNRQFSATLVEGSPVHGEGEFNGGLVQWTGGDNDGFRMEVKTEGGSPSTFTLYLPMVRDIAIGDTFTIRPGCDKSAAMCKGRYDNLVNYRGHGSWVPGQGEMAVFGGQTAEKKPRSDDFLRWPRAEPE